MRRKSKLQRLQEEKIREKRKKQGYFDGRFRPKVQIPRNKYTRKIKNRNEKRYFYEKDQY